MAEAAPAETPSGRALRAAVWQGPCRTGDGAGSLREVARVVDSARADKVELLLFPELFSCGYSDSFSLLQLQDLRSVGAIARESGVCIAFPYAERVAPSDADTSPTIYNSCAVFDAYGALAWNYRKVNLWGAWEQSVFEPGAPDQLQCFDLRLASGLVVRCGALICYDVESPEPARCLALAGAELLLVPTALGHGELQEVTPLRVLPTRALENHVFVMYSNFEGSASQGDEGNKTSRLVPSFCGRSAILAPNGQELARAREHEGGKLLTATLRLEAFAASVARNPYLSERANRWRSGHYAALSQGSDESRGIKRERTLIASMVVERS